MPSLFDPIQLGSIACANRIVMAPLTRARCTADHVPTPILAPYYAQRASAGLIISEATGISLAGLCWPFAPGIWNEAQIEAWKPVTDAVHRAGGRIVCQIWHGGRVVHPRMPGRPQPVSASATAAPGMAHTYAGKFPYTEARPLRVDEVPALLDDYHKAARNAMRAGFDGAQIHAANGYLIDQFLRDNANFRDDEYGGAVDNRIRLLGQVAQAVVDAIGGPQTSVRLSPNGERQGVNDSNPEPLFTAAARRLHDIGIGFLEIREAGPDGTNGKGDRPPIAPAMRRVFTGPLVLNADYTQARAQAALDAGQADAISFGRLYLANPDLVQRFARNQKLTPDDMSTWYTQGTEGYLDYAAAE
jgi:2,4-dienoyl-CoA reductase-like NADH-dependent reductase (Old Yellow Enzyme family)